MDTPKYEVKADEALVNAVDCAGSNENYMSEIVVGTRSGMLFGICAAASLTRVRARAGI